MAAFGQLDRDVEVNNGGGGGSVTILADDVYELEFTELDMEPAKSGNGKNMTGKVQVASGPHKGVWFFGGINNVQHSSAQAQAIAQGTLKALCLATGVDFDTLEDTEQLKFRPFYGRVGSETYFSNKHRKDMTKNVVLKYMYEGMPEEDEAAAPPTAKSAPAPARETEKPAATGRRPWEKN
jgi:hypothetical protein